MFTVDEKFGKYTKVRLLDFRRGGALFLIQLLKTYSINCSSGQIGNSLDPEMSQRFHILLWEKAAAAFEVLES